MEKFLKNREKLRANKEKYTLKIMKVLRAAILGPSFTGSYEKKSVLQQEEGNHYAAIKEALYRFGDATCFFIFRVRVLCLPSN